MKSNEKVFVKKARHSRGMLSGIFRIPSYCSDSIKADNLCYNNEKVEYLRQKPLGMSANLTGFTLIELLVVVLIIGILAAVAVPQYQRAVLKARSSQLFAIAKHFKDVCSVDLLAGGTCAKLEDIGWEYSLAGYTYDEANDLETGTVNGFPVEHRTYSFSVYDTQSDLVVYVSGKTNAIFCVAMNHAQDIEKVCESMGGIKDPRYVHNASTFYRL